MRILFMGTPEFSVPTLECLYRAGHEVVGVVTQPDKPRGRGGAVSYTPVKEKALELKLPVYQPRRVRAAEFLETVRELAPEAIVVIAFGQILPQALLDIPRYGCINIHASLLPRYRGAAPIQWAVIHGEKESGITIMQMDAGLDTGDMLKKQTVPLAPDETGGSLHDKLMTAGGPLLLETLKEIEAGEAAPEPQIGESCYASMLDKAMGDIDWSRDAAAIERLVRGLNPWPSAYTHWKGKTLKLWRTEIVGTKETAEEAGSQEMRKEAAGAEEAGAGEKLDKTENSRKTAAVCPGTVLSVEDGILVQTGAGVLRILELQLEGKKRMDADAFLRGARMEAGDVLMCATIS